MNIINIPLGSDGSVSVNEANDTISIVVDATILGTPESATLNFSLPMLLTLVANSIANPLLKSAFGWLIALL